MTMRRPVATIMLALLAVGPFRASAGNRVDSLLSVIDRGNCQAIEGVWRLTASPETIIAISSCGASDSRFDIWLLDSPDYRVEPCVHIGQATEGARRGSYDLTMCEQPGKKPVRKHSFIAEFENGDSGRLILKAYKRGKRISVWRWLPYMFRVTVIDRTNRPTDHDGLVRIYPDPGSRLDL